MSAPPLTLAGALTLDRYPGGDRPGGSVVYGARALGGACTVVTAAEAGCFGGADHGDDAHGGDGAAVGEAFAGATLRLQRAATTATFENRYDAAERVSQWLHAPAPSVAVDVPSGTGLLILAPVLGELQLEAWVAAAPAAMVTLGAQGMLRAAPEVPGPVVPRPWRPSEHLLARLDAVFLSTEDIRHQPALVPHLRRRVPLVVVTDGPEGASAFAAGRTLHVPARRVPVVDPTGAGDTFHAVAAARLAEGQGLEAALGDAARAAARCVSRAITPRSTARPARGRRGLDLPRRSGTV